MGKVCWERERNLASTNLHAPETTSFSQHLCSPAAAATAKSLQSCPTLCDPIDSSPPGSPVPGILQARTLEWVAISFSNAWKWRVKVKSFSRDRLLATPWTAAYQAPRPWDFPGKSTGVGCHRLLLCSPNHGQIIILGTQNTSFNKTTSTCLRAFILFPYNWNF